MSDHEFGVPFPGRVLPGAQWTKTGFRDVGKPFEWENVFGRTAPRVVDLGCGNGRYLLGSAVARPEVDHLGIDLVQVAIDHAAHRANQRGLTNVRFPAYLAACLAMLPGTLLYVYYGKVFGDVVAASGGGEGKKSPWEWALLGVGLLATIAVTALITKKARKALAEEVDGE